MNSNLILGLTAIIILFAFQIIIFLLRYKSGYPNKALVIHGKLEPNSSHSVKVLVKGKVFVWPIIQHFYYLNIESRRLDFMGKYTSSDKKKYDLRLNMIIKPKSEIDDLEIYVNKYFEMTEEQIDDKLKSELDIILMAGISAENSSLEINKLIQKLKDQITTKLDEFGLEISNPFSIILH